MIMSVIYLSIDRRQSYVEFGGSGMRENSGSVSSQGRSQISNICNVSELGFSGIVEIEYCIILIF